MTSRPGTTGKTDVPPDEAIEEISGLLEMDEVNAGGSQTADSSGELEADAAHADTSDVSHALDVSLETPSPMKLESYLLPPPVADEPASGQAPEAESASATNMAYEDLLEKLVLPTPSAAPDENEAAEELPPFASSRPSSSHAASSPLANLFPPGAPSLADVSDERTVVTANPLLAEEQEAAAREAENFILPAAPVAPPVFVEPQVLAPPVVANLRPAALAPNKFIQISYPMFGFMMLAAVLVGGVLSRLMAPTTPTVVTPPPAQAPTLVARPVVPAQPTQPANPAPQVVPLPTPTEPPAPAPRAAQPAATAEARAPGEIPAAQPATEELGMDEAQPVARAKVHHAAKPPRPPKSAAPRPVVVKPVAAAKPATSKKPGKGGWVDPFAQ
jgi:hypothetical protein